MATAQLSDEDATCPICEEFSGTPQSVESHITASGDDDHRGESGFKHRAEILGLDDDRAEQTADEEEGHAQQTAEERESGRAERDSDARGNGDRAEQAAGVTGQEVGVDPNAPALEEADVDESEDVDESKADPAAEPQGSSAENGDTTPSDTAKPAMPEMAGDDGADLEDGEDDDDRDDDAEEPIEAKVEPVAPEDELGDLLERQRELVDRQMALLEDAAEEAVDEIEAEPDSGPEEVAVEPVESEKTSNGLAIPVSSTTLVLGAVGLAGVMIWLGRRRIQGQGQVAEDDQEDVVGGTVGQPLVDDTARLVDDLPEELKDEFDDWA